MSKETSSKVTPDSIDFQNPLFVGEQVTENNTFTLNPNSFELKPFNPSNLTSEGGVDEEVQFDALQDYRWRLRVSPCSVSCGKGEGAVVWKGFLERGESFIPLALVFLFVFLPYSAYFSCFYFCLVLFSCFHFLVFFLLIQHALSTPQKPVLCFPSFHHTFQYATSP